MKSVLIIAEAGVNHNGKLAIAKDLVDVAAMAGADYVKFQTFKTEKIVSKSAGKAAYQIDNMRSADGGQFEMLKRLELDKEKHEILIDHCSSKGIRFLSSAFDLESIDLLEELDIDLYKIPSGEITNLPYLEKIASKKKPVILSTGMANMEEINAALKVLYSGGVEREEIIVLHCNTEYPTPIEDVNLRAMNTIAEAFDVRVGYSDHTLGIEVPIAAFAMGAVCIEKHFTLDRTMDGPDHKASLEPHELKDLIQSIRNIETALGNGIKKPSNSEDKNISVARKSIHLTKDLPEGHILQRNDLAMKRPGDGISPMKLYDILNRSTKRDLEKDHKLLLSDLRR